MFKHRRQPFVLGAFLFFLLLSPLIARGENLASCTDPKAGAPIRIRCTLWRLMAYMYHSNANGQRRETGLVVLGPDRCAMAEVSTQSLISPWPQSITLKFYEGSGSNRRLLEEIRDHGLNGLALDDSNDAYLRYSNPAGSRNLLDNLDPNLLAPINEDYLARLDEIIGILKNRTEIHEPLSWQEISPGLELARFKAFRYIRLGNSELLVLRLDPSGYDLAPYSHLEGFGLQNIEAWAEQIPRAAALFNSGQYYPDYRYIGLFLKDGANWGTSLHAQWKALLLSGGPIDRPACPPVRILDLEYNAFDPARTPYRFAVQSFMLLDHKGVSRVRQTDRIASRTVLAQDEQGRVLVILVPGGCTLYELSLLLKQSDLGIKTAMSLDGGLESQLYVRRHSESLAVYGAFVVNDRRQYYNPGLKLPLPAVFAVVPREKP